MCVCVIWKCVERERVVVVVVQISKKYILCRSASREMQQKSVCGGGGVLRKRYNRVRVLRGG